MIYLAIFVLIFVGFQLIVAFLNFVFKVNYKRFKGHSTNELVSVIIPARNEESNIGNILDDLCHQTYTNIEIIVADDDSADKTGAIVLDKALIDSRVNLIRAGLHDKNWLGKNHACHEAAEMAEGKFLLFVDADVRLKPCAIAGLLGYFKQQKVSLLSVFPRQIMTNETLYTIIPLMNYILLTLLPLILVRRSRNPTLSAANGQVMLFDTDKYRYYEPHKIFRRQKVEDIHIARFFKKHKQKIACVTAMDDISCKMYDTVEEALQGFSKNIVAVFGDSALAAAAFWLINLFGFVPVLLTFSWKFYLIYFAMLLLIRVFTSFTSLQSASKNIQYHFHQLVNLGKLILLSEEYKKTKNYQWKGRNIS